MLPQSSKGQKSLSANDASVYDSPALLSADPLKLVSLLESGGTFHAYSLKNAGRLVRRENIQLFLGQADSENDRYLFWSEFGAPRLQSIDNAMDLEEIESIGTGREAAGSIFAHMASQVNSDLAQVDDSRLVTLIGQHVSLELEAQSKAQAQVWCRALRALTGKSAEVNHAK